MKKVAKRISLVLLVSIGFILPSFANNDEPIKDEKTYCDYVPYMCGVGTNGAGGSGHGGSGSGGSGNEKED